MKKKILNAVKELIKGYEGKNLRHCPTKCPLCINLSCYNCPNLAFNSCSERCRDYPKLNYLGENYVGTIHDNDEALALFWQEVYEHIKNSDETKIGVLNIDFSINRYDYIDTAENIEYLKGIKAIAEKYK